MSKTVDERKAAFVAALALSGLPQKSCDEAGIPARRLQEWRRDDSKFDAECRDAERRFAERVEEHAIDLAMNGTVKKRFDKDGNVVHEETVYPVNLLTTILRKVNPAYRERNEVDVHVAATGVLAVGAPIGSADDWRRACEAPRDAERLPERGAPVLPAGSASEARSEAPEARAEGKREARAGERSEPEGPWPEGPDVQNLDTDGDEKSAADGA